LVSGRQQDQGYQGYQGDRDEHVGLDATACGDALPRGRIGAGERPLALLQGPELNAKTPRSKDAKSFFVPQVFVHVRQIPAPLPPCDLALSFFGRVLSDFCKSDRSAVFRCSCLHTQTRRAAHPLDALSAFEGAADALPDGEAGLVSGRQQDQGYQGDHDEHVDLDATACGDALPRGRMGASETLNPLKGMRTLRACATQPSVLSLAQCFSDSRHLPPSADQRAPKRRAGLYGHARLANWHRTH
jgi:hypothetical protein